MKIHSEHTCVLLCAVHTYKYICFIHGASNTVCVAPYVHYVQPRLDIPLAPTSVPPPPAEGRDVTLKAARGAPAPLGQRGAHDLKHSGKYHIDTTLIIKVLWVVKYQEHRRSLERLM